MKISTKESIRSDYYYSRNCDFKMLCSIKRSSWQRVSPPLPTRESRFTRSGQCLQNVDVNGPHHRCSELIVSSLFNQPMAVVRGSPWWGPFTSTFCEQWLRPLCFPEAQCFSSYVTSLLGFDFLPFFGSFFNMQKFFSNTSQTH